MAVIDEYYSSRLDLGPPATVALMAGFMGERERMNRMIIDQMLAAADPTKLAEAENDARKAKNDLLKLKAQVQVEGRKADVGLVKIIAGYEAGNRSNEARERVAQIAAKTSIYNSTYAGNEKRRRTLEAGTRAAESQLDIVRGVKVVAGNDAQTVGEYDKAIEAAVLRAGGERGLSGEAQDAAKIRLAEEAYNSAVTRGHTAAAAHIKATYFGGQDIAAVKERMRPMSEDEVRTFADRVPVGGVANSPTLMNVLRGEGATSEQTDELLSTITGAVSSSSDVESARKLGPYMADPEVREAGVGTLQDAASVASRGVPTGDIDAAIAQIDQQLASLQAQRSRRPSLASVAAGRYPNYLYTNPFQVGSRQFDQFARETGAMDPVAAQRLVGALAEAPPVFPARFARRELERTDPAQVEVEGFRPTGGDTGGGVLEELSKRFLAAQKTVTSPIVLGDRGDTVTFTDKGVTIKENTPEGKTVTAAPGSKVYNTLFEQAAEKAAKDSGLTGLLTTLPAGYSDTELASVLAATESGGFGAGFAETMRLKNKGDVPLATVYAEELERVGNIKNTAEREDALQTLVASLPEKAEWAQAMRGVADAPVEETGRRATSLAKQIKDAYTAPEGEVSQAERKAALAGQKTKAEKAEVTDVAREKSLADEAARLGASMDERLGLTPGMGGKLPVTAARPEATIPKAAAVATPDRGAAAAVEKPSAEDEAREAYLKAESARLGASMDERLGLVAPPSVSQAPVAEQAVREALARGNLTPKADAAVDGMVIPSAAAARGYLPVVEQKGAMPMPDIVADSMMPGYTTTSATPVPRSAPDKAAQARVAAQAAATKASREKARLEEVARNAAKAAKAAPVTKPVPATVPAPAAKPSAKAPTKLQAELDAALLED